MHSFKISLAAALLCSAVTANAAQQCFGSAGVYGAVTVTQSAGCTTAPRAINPGPLNIAGNPSLFLMDPLGDNTPVTCQMTFSKPIATSSIRVAIDALDTGVANSETTAIGINGAAYTVTAANLSALPGGTGPNPLRAAGGLINGPVAVGTSSGTFSFGGDASPSATSISIAYNGEFGTAIYGVCLDDADYVAPAATSIPTLSEWGMIAMASLVALIGFGSVRRRVRA